MTTNTKNTYLDSGIILINDVQAAKRVLLKFQQNECSLLSEQQQLINDTGDQKLLFEENIMNDSVCIEAQYNEIKQTLLLRRVSGELENYNALCKQLINNI